MHTLEQLRSGQLAGIRRLDLSAQLTEFPPEIFALADTLEVLNLSHNALRTLPPELPRLHRLNVLFASYNQFTDWPQVLGQCPQLRQVGLRNNQIRHLPADGLPPQLRWLTLTDNALTHLPDALGTCQHLEKLMLSGNPLQTLPEGLAHLPALALLRVAATQLRTLPGWLWELPALAWLAAAGSPWCDEAAPRPCAAAVPDLAWATLRVHERLGEGASGWIHRADWAAPGQPPQAVALKLFKGTMTSDGLPHSEQAACLAAGPHPNVMGALGRVSDHPQGQAGLVMPLLPPHWQALAGPPSLASCSRDEYAPGLRLPPNVALRLLRDAAHALAHLHRQNVLHGDFYAHNLLWSPQHGQAMLSDFGAALRWPLNHAATWGQAQRLDVLAFGHLLDEVRSRLDDSPDSLGLNSALRSWWQACTQARPAHRPDMATVAAALAAL